MWHFIACCTVSRNVYVLAFRSFCLTGDFGKALHHASKAAGAFPGGTGCCALCISCMFCCVAGVTQSFGTDLSKSMLGLSQNVGGPAGAALVPPVALASQGASAGAGFVQAILAAVIHIVPPLIPPPVWINKPLPCAPMVSLLFLLVQRVPELTCLVWEVMGHNCFGAVLSAA